MLYPQKLSSKKSDLLIKILLVVSLIIAILLVIINKLTTKQIHWAGLANAGIIYTWVTVLYSLNKHRNIAGHVMIQLITIGILTTYIDYKIGFKGWSLEMSIPIIIIIANITMFVLTIVSYKRYIRYAIYQLIICLFSLLPAYFLIEKLVLNPVLSYVAIGISCLNFLLTIFLCARDVKEAIKMKFHT